MPTGRLSLALGVVFLALIGIVLLRAEATRRHYELSQLDGQARILRQELREKELELARLRNPALIAERLRDWYLQREIPATPRPAPRRGRPSAD